MGAGTKGVFGDARTAGDRERRGVADGGARVPEVLAAAELEVLVARVIVPELREPRGIGHPARRSTFVRAA